MKKFINTFLIIVLVGSLFSCSKSDLNPTLAQNKDVGTSINTQEDIQGLLYGAYDRMTHYYYYGRDYIIYGEVRTDNCFSNGNSGRFVTVGAMKMLPTSGYATNTWTQMYRVIGNANIIIAQDPAKLTGDQKTIKNIIGQAYAIRALAHFDLLKLYGEENVTGGNNVGIPYITEFKGNNILPKRNTVDEVKTAIQADLTKALSLMDPALNDYAKRETISTYAVNALQSRVALYFGDYATAKTAAEAVINSGKYSIAAPADYANTWIAKGTANVIFELAERPTDNQNINGLSQIYRGNAYGDIQALEDILTIFDPTDVRVQANMIGYENGILRNIGKYPTNANFDYDIPLIRYEEVVLNYAEALFQLGDNAGALAQLNSITAQRNATAYTAATEANILKERRRELCFEGFRFDDLARTHRDIPLVAPLQQTMGTVKYGDYNYAFPIPQAEIDANSNMTQNKGY